MDNEKKLILMRGVPGSGKSTKAHSLGGVVFAADDFWGPKYKFNPFKLIEAHEWNAERCRNAMAEGLPLIVIDNCNIYLEHQMIYRNLAKEYGYEIEIVEPDTPWRYDALSCWSLCTHDIPYRKIEKLCNHLKQEKEREEKRHAAVKK